MRSIRRSMLRAELSSLPSLQRVAMSISCPGCRSDQIHRSRTRGIIESLVASYGFARIDAKNVTIVFSAGPYDPIPRKPCQHGEAVPETAAHSHLPRACQGDHVPQPGID
jgi:hypothetical protein